MTQQTSSFIFSEKLKIKKNIWEFHSLQFCQALVGQNSSNSGSSSSISGYFGCNQRKCTFRHVRPGNTWISLHLGIVSPGFAAHPKNLASLASLWDPFGYILALNMILFFRQSKCIDISFHHKNICCGYSLEAPQWGTSNEYPQHVFMEKRKIITKTCLYNFDPLKPHFYIVKLGFTGVDIICIISA